MPLLSVSASLRTLRPSAALLAPVQVPLGILAALRGLAAPLASLRRPLSSHMSCSTDSSLGDKGGMQVRLHLLWDHALQKSQAWWC